MQQVLGKACTLNLPVAPDAHSAVVDMVSAHDHVDRSMHLDAGYLRTAKLHHIVDMVNMIVLNDTEHTAHTTDDAALLAMMYVISADNVAADGFFHPAMELPATDGVALHLGGALNIFVSEVVIVIRIMIFAK